jgi:hypothetical protein
MKNNLNAQKLLKILVGAAWLDGVIKPEERAYLRSMATYYNLTDNAELKPFLSELKPVQPAECYKWLKDYVGENPTQEDYQGLLEAISGLIYSDGDIPVQEAKLLNHIQLLAPSNQAHHSTFEKVLKVIQKLYRQAISEHV